MGMLASDTLASLYLKQGHARQALATLQAVQEGAPEPDRADRITALGERVEQPRLQRLEELLARIRQTRER